MKKCDLCNKDDVIIDSRSKVEGVSPFFMSSSMQDFLDNFFDLCREYQDRELTSSDKSSIATILRYNSEE